MSNTEPNRETNWQTKPGIVPSELSPQNRTLHAPTPTSPGVRETIDRTQDCDLFATLKSGTAAVETLKLLIPGFELLEELGRGAFGVVYRARDEALDRQVAIKVSLIDDPKRREQYIKEARSAAKIDTHGIVTVFQVGTLAGGQPFVVQRLIEGGTLRQALAKSGPIGVRHACWLMSEIALVIAKAHALGMIHRDIKPDNILLDPGGQPWVADFGLAILEADQIEQGSERAGTPLYMSPEQLCGRVDWLDGRTDIYAMGIMLYEMLVGRTPFDARNLAELEQQVLHRDPKPISQRAPHVPIELDAIFGKCCAKKVEDRYPNANALVDDLQSLLAELPEGESTVSPFAIEGRHVPLSVHRSGSSRGANHSTNRNSGRRITLRQTSPLDETLELKRAKPLWRRWATPASMALFASGLVGLMMLLRPGEGKSPEQQPVEANLSASTLPTLLAADSQESQPPKLPERPFRVSKASDATHHTIAAAIAAAEVGETITILPGTYFESLQIDRAVRLVGEGSREDIVIVGENQSALVVELNGQSGAVVGGDASPVIELVNLTLEGNKKGQEDFNTIEVKRGSLTLTECNVNTRSWDCVKLQPQSSLNAKSCNFRSSTHPAISAKQASGLTAVDCSFDIRPLTLDSPSIPVGIQASDSPGLVQRCTFAGSGAAIGIHWKGTNQHVSIEDANFGNCEIGFFAQACGDIHVSGSTGTHFNGCGSGLLLEGCTAAIDGSDIQCVEGKIGIRIVDDADLPQAAKVQLSNCTVSGYETGLSIEHAHVSALNLKCERSISAGVQVARQGQLHMEGSTISDNDKYGIYVQDAIGDFIHCHISSSGYAGVYLDTSGVESNFKQCTLDQNKFGLLMVAGSAKLEQCDNASTSVGVLVSTYEILGLAPVAQVVPISIAIVGGKFLKNPDGHLLVCGPCRISIDGWDGSPLSEMPTPKIIEGLDIKLEKNVYEISGKSGRNNGKNQVQ